MPPSVDARRHSGRHPLPKRFSPAWISGRMAGTGWLSVPRLCSGRLVEYGWRRDSPLRRRVVRLVVSLGGVAALTWTARVLIPVNAATAGFGYLLLILVIASAFGFLEALAASLFATLAFNYFFFPPIGAFSIQDPENWVALFSFLATSVIASRLSAIARRRALDAVSRQQDLERLYAFSRGILTIGGGERFPDELVRLLAEIFQLAAVVLHHRESGESHYCGTAPSPDLDDQLRESAWKGSVFSDPGGLRRITPVCLQSEPIASLALVGAAMPDSVVQGIANLVAIGLERARVQDLAHQVEAARRSEQLRTTLIDAMAHEFKTPLTTIKAATTSLLADPAQPEESKLEMLRVADESADHLKDLIEDAVDMGRLDTARIDVDLEFSDLGRAVREVVESMKADIDNRQIDVASDAPEPSIPFDRRLVKLAVKQLLDNALKYSTPESPIRIRIHGGADAARLDISNRGPSIPLHEQARLFDRFYRSSSVKANVPGSGLGLCIAQRIAQAHRGDLTVTSRSGETTFRLTLPVWKEEARA